jgi:hypothetical protein
MRFTEHVLSVVVMLGCHAEQPASSPRSPVPCRDGAGNSISVDAALAIKDQLNAVTVEGYLVLVPGPCTLMGCPNEHPNCNTCEGYVRIAASRAGRSKTLRLHGSSVSYTCLSRGRSPCVFDATGQHVLAQGTLHYSENEIEPVSLHDPKICELSP